MSTPLFTTLRIENRSFSPQQREPVDVEILRSEKAFCDVSTAQPVQIISDRGPGRPSNFLRYVALIGRLITFSDQNVNRLYSDGDLGLFFVPLCRRQRKGPKEQEKIRNMLALGEFIDDRSQTFRRPVWLYTHKTRPAHRDLPVRWAPNIAWLGRFFINVALLMTPLRLPLYVLLEVLDWLPLFAEHLDHVKKVQALRRIFSAYDRSRVIQHNCSNKRRV